MVTTTAPLATVLTSYYRPKPGGFCKRLFRGINALLEDGCEVHYLAVVPFPIDHKACHFHRFPWPARFTDTWLFWAVFHLLAPLYLLYLGIRHRVTHAFAFGPTYALLLQPVRWIRHIPLSLYLRADTLENHRIKGRSDWLIRLETFLEGIAINGVHLYGVSETLTRTVAARHTVFSPQSSTTLRNDIDCGKIGDIDDPGDPVRMACVGILERRKNQSLIIECLPTLDPGSVILDLYGTGHDRDRLEQLAVSRGVGQLVNLKGWTPVEEIWPNVDLLLMPSLHEGAPNAVLEALEQNIPVLASDIPEHREILPASVLLPLADETRWISRIEAILESPAENLRRIHDEQCISARRLCFDWNARFVSAVLQDQGAAE